MRPEDTSGQDPALVRALSHMHYGLYFLSTDTVGKPCGMLVSWVCQASGNPPMVMIAVRQNRGILSELERTKSFALNLLPAGDERMRQNLSRPGAGRFQGVELEEGPLGLPFLAEGLGAIFCRVQQRWQPGDHVLFCAEAFGAIWKGPGPAMSAAETGHAYLGLK